MAEVLKSRGYATGLAGKWGLGHEGSLGVPTRQGFDFFFGYLDQHHAHNYYPTFLIRNEKRVALRNEVTAIGEYGGGYATKKVDYSADLIMKEALGFIDENKDRPFFLYVAHTLPHANNEANRALKDGSEVPSYGIYENKPWNNPTKGVAAMITYLDTQVGQLMARLKHHGIDENTIVFFTSDNGPHREAGHDPDFFDSNGPLRGLKRDLYEGGIRVPTIVRWPGKTKPGTVSTFAATAAELAGADAPEKIDGLSFVPAILGQSKKQQQHEYLYWEFYERGSAQAIRTGKWKGVRKPMLTGDLELYDLDRDIGETNNIAKQNPEVVARILKQMQQAHVPSPDWKIPSKKRPKPGKS